MAVHDIRCESCRRMYDRKEISVVRFADGEAFRVCDGCEEI